MWRHALRRLLHTPAFTVSAVLVLALGIGAGTAMYSVLNTVLLQPLPFAQPQRLLHLELRAAGGRTPSPTPDNIRDWRQRASDFSSIAFAAGPLATLQRPGGTDLIVDIQASANLLATLGVRPWLGRGFSALEENNSAPVAILTYALWKSEFRQARNIVGREIRLGGKGYTVIGVLPPGVSFPLDEQTLMTPFAPSAAKNAWVQVIGRLRDGITPAAARAQLNAVQAAFALAHPAPADMPDMGTPRRVLARNYRQELTGAVRPALTALAAVTALVWLIACLSVAGLLLTRFAGRRRELAVRSALGATRTRLLHQLLAECALVACAAAAAGWALAAGGMALLRHYVQAKLPGGLNSIHVSGTALWGLIGISALSVLVAGLVPALLASANPAQAGLRDSGNAASSGRGQTRLRDGLVIGEIALALLLLAGAGLLLRTLHNLRAVPLGFSTRNIITTPLQFPPGMFAHRDAVASFYRPLLQRVHALPGVEAAAVSSVIPMESGFGVYMYLSSANHPPLRADLRVVSPGFAQVFGIPMLRGRFFNAGDTPHAPRVMVVNQAFAQQYFHSLDVVGKKIGPVIVGVIANVHGRAPGVPPGPVLFYPMTQPFITGVQFSDLAVRTRNAAAAAIPELRRLLHQLAPEVAGTDFETMQQLVSGSMASQIFAARLLSLFGLSALAIALAGLYGLLAYTVTERRREMGIRMALGAEPGQIMALVLTRAAALVAIGVALGLLLAWELSHILASYLYGVSGHDAISLLMAAILLGLCAFAAAWFPARRAAASNPLDALRSE